MNDNNNTNEGKVMLSGRVEADQKQFVDSIWDKSKGETFSDAINKLREAYINRAVKIEGLDLSADREFLNKCITGIQASIKSITEKTEMHLTEQAYSVENRLTEKDMLLKEADESFKILEDDYKLQIEQLKEKLEYENKLKEQMYDDYKGLENAFEESERENENKTLTINAFLEEKRNLSAELADNRAKTTELQNKINDLHKVEVDNISLREEKDNLKNEIRDYKSEISMLNTKLESLDELNKVLNTDISLLKKDIEKLKDEKANIDFEHKKALIDLERNKEIEYNSKLEAALKDIKAKYEEEINKDVNLLKKEIEKMKDEKVSIELQHKKALIDLERNKEIEYNSKLDATLKDIKVKHEEEINNYKEKLFMLQMELKQLKK